MLLVQSITMARQGDVSLGEVVSSSLQLEGSAAAAALPTSQLGQGPLTVVTPPRSMPVVVTGVASGLISAASVTTVPINQPSINQPSTAAAKGSGAANSVSVDASSYVPIRSPSPTRFPSLAAAAAGQGAGAMPPASASGTPLPMTPMPPQAVTPVPYGSSDANGSGTRAGR